MLRNIQAIFFDLDNTLLDRDQAFWLCLEAYFKEQNFALDLKKHKKEILEKDNFGYTSRATFCNWFVEKYSIPHSAKDLYDYLIQNISQYISPASTALKRLLSEWSKDFRLGILTNGSIQNQTRKIQKANLQNYFAKNDIYISQAFQLAKPNKEIFKLVLKDLKIKPQHLLYIGDNPIADVYGASQMNIKTCWISHGKAWMESFCYDFKIKEILDLEKIHLHDL